MQGDKVIVRAFGNEPLVRVVWENTDSAVCVTTESEYRRSLSGADDITFLGFPLGDVYRFDRKALVDLEKNFKQPSAWARLKTWNENGG